MKKSRHGMASCICGAEFMVQTHMRDLETTLCETCFKREAYIVLLIQKTKQLKRERPYPVRELIRMEEYHATKKQLTS